ncbi:putative alpha-tubulin N-acetyltransferase [Cardiosporidium cionae]|uniref:Alpha-tubulin N-acetyltransferase n=1 Tax=Cardiosporidium cionae TaxID=476202 RepID=A0ABQ7J7S1_9APIC|nr:putative alpha-tubulin N-acetyltransferase [Cardiosporidium cionae]|eukprot:KAF8820040.1 putative alpha-tubulin N-acetyltransferase [Cardiosporidium cionae]
MKPSLNRTVLQATGTENYDKSEAESRTRSTVLLFNPHFLPCDRSNCTANKQLSNKNKPLSTSIPSNGNVAICIGAEFFIWPLKSPEQYFCNVINELGKESARAQKLKAPITSSLKLADQENQIYVQFVRNRATGLLRVGIKNLWMSENKGLVKADKLCVLDFYIVEEFRRQGYGKILFNCMLEIEGIEAKALGYDRPSSNFLVFLKKHYNLTSPKCQFNNFVIFDQSNIKVIIRSFL